MRSDLVAAHFARLGELLDQEREAEKEESRLELERFPVSAREALGRTVSRLSIDGAESGVGPWRRLVLSRAPHAERLAPFHAMSQGDNVRITFPAGTRPPHADATLERVDEYRVTAAVEGPLPEPLPGGRCTVDLLSSDATYKRAKKALQDASRAQGGRKAELRDMLLGALPPRTGPLPEPAFFDPQLNRWQKEAVRRALAAPDVSIIHCPPGTGKTTVLVEIIRQAAARGERVLASAPSNIAVDNILEKILCAQALRLVRLGHPARILEPLRHATLAWQAAADPQYAEVQELDAWRERLSRRAERTGSRSAGSQERREMRREVQRLWREARRLENAIERRVGLRAQVVISTHGGIGEGLLKGEFDWVVLDEASQATEPLSWIALLKGKRVVLAGDAKQLPPTLHSKEAAAAGLALTLFERLMPGLPEGLQTLLRVQYRMHERIMEFPSREFYEGKLVADESVRRHLACELEGARETDLTSVPLVFVDTAGAGFDESFDELLQSRANEGEAGVVGTILGQLLEAGIRAEDIAVLTPYVAQVRRLKAALRAPGLEIGTVDVFQGREKEAAVISLVRSNERGEVGFLADTRRMNVAVTRARRLLILVGDSATISRHPFYSRFVDYADSLGAHRSAWEWLGPQDLLRA